MGLSGTPMKTLLLLRIQREIAHFKRLPNTVRLLVISYFLRSVAYPLITIFTSAYIWQTNHDVTLLILYNVGDFAILPLLFIVNRWLLRRIRVNTLYSIGTVLTGISALMVIFYRSTTPEAYLFYGVLYGIGNGIYWANRNFLTLRHTTSDVRSYFTGLQFALGTIASVIVPPIAGWFIVTTNFGYETLVTAAFAILLAAGLIFQKTTFDQPTLTDNHQRLSPLWRRVRFLSIAIGCVDSVIYILPTVLVLQALGNEGVLGIVNCGLAILTAGVSYVCGRKFKSSQYLPIFTGMLVAFIIAGIPLIFGISMLSVIWYLTIANLADSVIWIANEPVIMDMMDDEAKRSQVTHYRLIIDREWFVDMGRVGTLVLFMGITLYNPTFAIQIVASISGIVACACVFPVLVKRTK